MGSRQHDDDLWSMSAGPTTESVRWIQVMPEARASAKLVGITRKKRGEMQTDLNPVSETDLQARIQRIQGNLQMMQRCFDALLKEGIR